MCGYGAFCRKKLVITIAGDFPTNLLFYTPDLRPIDPHAEGWRTYNYGVMEIEIPARRKKP